MSAAGPDLGRRLRDWPERLSMFHASVRDKPHAYGRHDCLLYPAGAVEAVTGVDLAAGHRGKYRSAAGASRYLRSIGFASAEALIDSLLPSRLVSFARRGDIVMGADGIPGVCLGERAAFVGVGEERAGLVTVATVECVRAWSVGEP